MLNYFITVTERLIIPATLAGLLYAWIFERVGIRGRRILHIGAAAGFVAAIAMAILKNKTSLIATGMWNVRIFTTSLIALILFIVLSVPALRRKLGRGGDIAASAGAALLLATILFYALPDVLAYPFTFTLNGASVFSSAYFTRFAGWLLGLILVAVTAVSVERAARRAGNGVTGIIMWTALGINALSQLGTMIQVLYTRRMIKGHFFFEIAKLTSKNSKWFIFAGLAAVIVIPIVIFIRSLHVNEPYENPAQHRKIRAKWRNAKRWACAAAVCFIIGVLTLTWLNAINSRPVELSPVEESELKGDNVYVSLDKVEDGHLHRFAYTTPDGITVRFIVIKKPNSSSYGVGLDACDICGETGYFERNGQIVCKLCDVVMNINTIGFKGGCNPIVIDYSVDGGYIIVPTSTLIEHQKEFKK
ncbi:MAG: DUF2318 domain-containing protein [Oscillospiraceae bacterium]|nr:DUF2318 domain-containing protein [Oscillospiraceae bacterium]